MKVWLTLLLAFTLHLPAFALSMNGFNLNNSLVPANQILRGGPPPDGIPALDHSHFEAADKAVTALYDDRTQTTPTAINYLPQPSSGLPGTPFIRKPTFICTRN